MGFFERPDPRLSATAGPAPVAAVAYALRRHAIALCVCLMLAVVVYIADVAGGLRGAAVASGTFIAPQLFAPVTILRDRRDIPHIRAANEHDLFFTEGYVQGSDRLFQLDLARRYAYGRLAEIAGNKALLYDKMQRAVDIDAVAQRQLKAMTPRDRAAVTAFSDGVNVAAKSQPLPVEFRMLLYRPAPWTPKDSVAVSVVASLELADSWHDVFTRDTTWRQSGPRCFDAFFPLSDARYDVTVNGARDRGSPRSAVEDCDSSQLAERSVRHDIGSNAWASGATRSRDGHALVANDPHLDLTIPGIWYLVDLQSPGLHVAGAAIPGMPGVVLGHNERVAWATTNAEMATTSVFEAGRLAHKRWTLERFHVRFAPDVTQTYYRTAREFSVPNDNDASAVALVRWPVYAERQSTIATALALDRARDIGEALRIVARYRGSPQNFIVADRSGRVAFHVAGLVPDDPAWGRYVHPARDLRERFAPIPFDRLPGRAPSRDAILVTANNKAFEPAYPYRLSAQFGAPYRAYRIAQLLHSRARFDAAYFSQMQLDTLSPIDAEIARDVVRFARTHSSPDVSEEALAILGRWDGRFAPGSRAASLEHALRAAVLDQDPAFEQRLNQLRNDPAAPLDLERDLLGMFRFFAVRERRPWGDAGSMRVEHLLAPMNFPFLNGARLPGEGDEYTIHLQEPGLAQGFRAVWDVGNWDAGGIAIPSGESGEPGSGHYTDLTRDWVDGKLQPLPFSDAAVRRDTSEVLVLDP